MQGDCPQRAPSVPVVANLTLRDVAVADKMCQILTNSGGLLSYYNLGNPDQVPTQPDVWVHGLHVINLHQPDQTPGTTDQAEGPVIHWAPTNTSARLWLTNVHFQHAHMQLYSGKTFVAGVHSPTACRSAQTWHVLDRVLVLVVLYVTHAFMRTRSRNTSYLELQIVRSPTRTKKVGLRVCTTPLSLQVRANPTDALPNCS